VDLRKDIKEGLWAEIVPLTYGRARIIVTDGFGVYDSW
jgi:hypothetical protein